MTISGQDIVLILLLAFLEGILSIDNALVLALLAKPLPPIQQRRALTYGLVGAIIFRLIAITFATKLIQFNWIKVVGGGYLLFVAIYHFIQGGHDAKKKKPTVVRGFWTTVLLIELMDIAFAVDSILAAVALTPRQWIIFLGGMMGVIIMRFAATVFVNLLNRFPGMERSAFILVGLIGGKLMLEAAHLPGVEFHSATSPAALGFWAAIILTLASGFLGQRKKK
jgi:YkoY family integral membrane protein